jgi:Fe-S oxidoreductase
VKIDIPWINTVVRDRLNHDAEPDEFDHLVSGLTPDDEPAGMDLQKRVFGHIDSVAKVGSALAPVSNWVADTDLAERAMERAVGVDARRDLPAFADETLHEWMAGRESLTEPEREVVLYPDVYTTYFDVERGKAAVRTLEALGSRVLVPEVPESGRAPLSQGMVETARERAGEVHRALVGHVDAGRDVVAIEPSDLTMFRDDYERLLPEASFERLRDASYEVLEYVYGLLENGADADALPAGDGALAYHAHCQQRTLGLERYTTAVFEDLGYDVTTSDVECCGMAGSFGYKREYYEVSVDVGEHLVETFDTEGRTVVASGTTCGEQLAALSDREARHPVELLDPDR